MSHSDHPDHSRPSSRPFEIESVRSSLQRIVTTTYLRGFGRILPNPYVPPGGIPSCQDRGEEGPALVLHGLAAAVPSTPLHFVGILEPGERIALSRAGFHKSRLQVLFGRCRLTCINLGDPKRDDHTGPVRTWDPTAGKNGVIHFPIELEACCADDKEGRVALEAGESPVDDQFVIYIESLGGASVILSSRIMIPAHAGMGGGDSAGGMSGMKAHAVASSLEALPAWEVYASSSCAPNCTSSCPHGMVFGGQVSPDAHHQ